MKFILASASPRRKELLEQIGMKFEVRISEAEEVTEATEPAEYVMELSFLKAEDVAGKIPVMYDARGINQDFVVIGSDTVVAAEDEILGKPANRDDAFAMLRMLSGCEHEVITGVTLRSVKQTKSFSAHSKVRFRNLTDEEIYYYIDTYKPMDKAGSYGIQEWIGYVGIEGIEGSFFNVMGLPIQRVWCELDKFIE